VNSSTFGLYLLQCYTILDRAITTDYINKKNMFGTRWSIFILYACCFIPRAWTRDIEIERLMIARVSMTTPKLYYSIDKFTNIGGGCSQYKAMCENQRCTRCVCRDFYTFISYTAGCLSKADGDVILAGEKRLQYITLQHMVPEQTVLLFNYFPVFS